MKLLLALIQMIGILFIGLNIGILCSATYPEISDISYLIGWYIGNSLFFILGVGLLMVVRMIKRKEVKRKANALIDSLPN